MDGGTIFEPHRYSVVSELRKVDEITEKFEMAVVEAQDGREEEMDFVL